MPYQEDFEDHCCDDKKNRYKADKKSSIFTPEQITDQFQFDKRDNYNPHKEQTHPIQRFNEWTSQDVMESSESVCTDRKCSLNHQRYRTLYDQELINSLALKKEISPKNEDLAIRNVISFFDYIEGKQARATHYADYYYDTFASQVGNMQITEQIQIPITSELSNLCRKTKDLWNHANWLIRMIYHYTLDPERPDVKKVFERIYSKAIEKIKKETNIDFKGKQRLYYDEMHDLIKYSRFFRALPTQTAQQVLRYLEKAWKGYRRAVEEWKINPDKFPNKRRPRPPGYQKKKGFFVAIFTNQQCNIQGDKLNFPRKGKYKANLKSTKEKEVWNKWQSTGILSLSEDERNILNSIEFPGRKKGYSKRGTTHWFQNEKWYQKLRLRPHVKSLNQVRIVPKGSCYVLEIVHTVRHNPQRVDKSKIVGVDIGMNNLLAIANNIGLPPMLVRGKVVKSINQYTNKLIAKYRSGLTKKGLTEDTEHMARIWQNRHNKIKKIFHQASFKLIKFCVANQIGKIIIGYNEGWKTNVKISRRFRRNFVPIPFLRLIHMIEYKAKLYGIEVIKTEESYTSQDCALCGQRHKKSTAKGRLSGRAYTGIYGCSKYHKLINSDINGAINIVKKVERRAFQRIDINTLLLPPIEVNVPYSKSGYSRHKPSFHKKGTLKWSHFTNCSPRVER